MAENSSNSGDFEVVRVKVVEGGGHRMVLEPKFADYGSTLHTSADQLSPNAASASSSQTAPSATTAASAAVGTFCTPLSTAAAGSIHRGPSSINEPILTSLPSPLPLLHSGRSLTSSNCNYQLLNPRNVPTTKMTKDDSSQCKPLLPQSARNDKDPWNSDGDALPDFYGGSDDIITVGHDTDEVCGSMRHSSNGIVKINIPSPIREEPRFPQERWKTVLAAVILMFNFILVLTSLSLVHERVPDRNVYGPLPDVFHEAVPAQDWGLSVSEYLLLILINSAVATVLLHKHRFIVARRAFLIMSLLYMYRSITMYVTVMPISSTTYYCSPKSNHTTPVEVVKRIVQLALGMGLSINGRHTYCGDYIYSGHTVILVFSYLLIAEYTPKKLYIIHWLYGLAAATGVIMLMIAHGHYTVDVIIAYYLTTRTFWIYHTLANYTFLKLPNSPNNLLGRAWWYRIFLYFEGNVGGTVPRQWPDWPFPWPRRLHAKSRES